MIKNLGRDYSAPGTTLRCMGGCCCCCCLQVGVSAYYGAKILRAIAGEEGRALGSCGHALALVFPIAGVLGAIGYGFAASESGAGMLFLAFFAPFVLAAAGLASWIGALVGTVFDALLGKSSGHSRLDALGALGMVFMECGAKSIGLGIAAMIVGIPLMFLFVTPLAWVLLPMLALWASVTGWESVRER